MPKAGSSSRGDRISSLISLPNLLSLCLTPGCAPLTCSGFWVQTPSPGDVYDILEEFGAIGMQEPTSSVVNFGNTATQALCQGVNQLEEELRQREKLLNNKEHDAMRPSKSEVPSSHLYWLVVCNTVSEVTSLYHDHGVHIGVRVTRLKIRYLSN